MTEPLLSTADERINPPFTGSERAQLEAWLEVHRATLLFKCGGLNSNQLKLRSVPPSALSLLGLVRHMAEVERNWFRRVLGGQDAPSLYCTEEHPDGDFDLVENASAVDDLVTYRAEVDEARTLASRSSDLGGVGAGKRRGQDVSLRWIYIHMIEEYARHNGHADLLRECVDGTVGE
ncbi:putative damage-inducible protein DinB [Nakamurella sp. UYEF19]|uniref:DinB family protein n=1 Tax=Nakamurella sp. UYEF19 TaxID=1756392 RepID=UPI0033978971